MYVECGPSPAASMPLLSISLTRAFSILFCRPLSWPAGDQFAEIWSLFHTVIHGQNLTLLKDRHADQILLCATYAVLTVHGSTVTMADVVNWCVGKGLSHAPSLSIISAVQCSVVF